MLYLTKFAHLVRGREGSEPRKLAAEPGEDAKDGVALSPGRSPFRRLWPVTGFSPNTARGGGLPASHGTLHHSDF